jgi:hypothetical protein
MDGNSQASYTVASPVKISSRPLWRGFRRKKLEVGNLANLSLFIGQELHKTELINAKGSL